ncbi:hypothetical protein C6P42_002914 [Pichia californica]|nr:hypothetical protein C6P42_002914 [[Candida] californica]
MKFLSKNISSRVTVLLQKIGGHIDCNAQNLRQAFQLLNEGIAAESNTDIAFFVTQFVNQNSGHNALTALNKYAYDADGNQDTRLDLFETGYRFMLARDSKIGFCKAVKKVEKVLTPVVSHLVFGIEELVEAKESLYDNLEFRKFQFEVINGIGACNHVYALQAATGFGKTVVFSIILKAIIKKDPGLVNLIVVPYSALEVDMTERLFKLGFNVGRFSEVRTVASKRSRRDVYVGNHSALKDCNLDILRNDLGLLVFDEAHSVSLDVEYRGDVIDEFKKYNLNKFMKIILLSATMPKTIAVDVCARLAIDSSFIYSNLIHSCSNVGKILIYQRETKFGYPIEDLKDMLNRYCDKFKVGKAVVFFRSNVLESVYKDVDKKYPRS